MSARDMFHYASGYTLEKTCYPHPGRGGQAHWTRGVHLIQGIPDHCLGLDLSGPGSSRGTEPIRFPFVGICRERLRDLCTLVILLSQLMGWVGGGWCSLCEAVVLVGRVGRSRQRRPDRSGEGRQRHAWSSLTS